MNLEYRIAVEISNVKLADFVKCKKKCKEGYDTNDEGIWNKIPEASSSDSGSEDGDPSDSVDPTSG